jgi:hypothetical protein
MKREAALRVHEQLKDLTVEQQIQFWQERNKTFKPTATKKGPRTKWARKVK